jgi:V/A-type H+-transporting ATPase subunit I
MIDFAVKMQHLSLTMLRDDAPMASIELAKLEAVHLIESRNEDSPLDEMPAMEYQQLYQSLNSRYQKIARYFEKTVNTDKIVSEAVSREILIDISNKVKKIWGRISDLEEEIRQAKDNINMTHQLESSLERFRNLDIDLGKLARESQFIKIFIGTIPNSEYDQLERALTLANTVMDAFHQADIHHYVTVVTSREQQDDVSEILKSAGFHEISIPQELHRHPDIIRRDIEKQLSEYQKQVDELTENINKVISDHRDILFETLNILTGAKPYSKLANALSGKGELVYLEGWIPENKMHQVNQQLQQHLHYPYLLNFREPQQDELLSVPFLEKSSRLLKPFRALVGQYGIPEYSEIDPTRLFALSYILMFGMMFGDIGHGAVIVLAGFLLRNKIEGLFTFAALAGTSSMIFGLLYGSLFGYEHVIDPVWMSPMEDPSHMLVLALYWGIGFLVIANLLSIYNLLALGQKEQAVFSNRGIFGLVLFLGSVYAGYQYMVNNRFGITEVSIIGIALSVILAKHWQYMDGSVAEKVLLIIIEGLDNMINILSSTLSFLRVAAFSLNHVALALAVFTLAGMMDTFGHIMTVILGNIFIIVLEGGIVAIQCLRLEYYEGFSRFFSGRGRRFNPLKIESVL